MFCAAHMPHLSLVSSRGCFLIARPLSNLAPSSSFIHRSAAERPQFTVLHISSARVSYRNQNCSHVIFVSSSPTHGPDDHSLALSTAVAVVHLCSDVAVLSLSNSMIDSRITEHWTGERGASLYHRQLRMLWSYIRWSDLTDITHPVHFR